MKSPNRPNILIGASVLPILALVAFMSWFMFVFRPSGQERWGDAASIFYFGALAYPLSIALLVSGGVGLYLRRRKSLGSPPSSSMWLIAASVAMLAVPWLLLYSQVVSSNGGL